MSLPKDFTPPPLSLLKGKTYHPVIRLPEEYDVYDFSQSYNPNRSRREFGVGKYNEHRPTMYGQGLFRDKEEPRTVHMGIDIGAPAGTPVFSFMRGTLLDRGYHEEPGDFGATLVTVHELEKNQKLYALWGHLSMKSLELRSPGETFEAGEVIAHVGEKHENGGWNPHLHFQLSWIKPVNCNLPGVVKLSDRERALKIFPDPLLVLGPLY
jgi:murein DD-endopeptidase MepM/ murein hydrolase activator NlpD